MLFLLFWPGICLASVLDRGVAECIYRPAATLQSGDFNILLRAIDVRYEVGVVHAISSKVSSS
jgi:hypothetical protein